MPQFDSLFLVLLGCALAGHSAPAHADEVPTTALSYSLGIASDLLDYPSLVYRYPQRAALTGSRAFALFGQSTDRHSTSVGGIVRRGSMGFFALTQPYYLRPLGWTSDGRQMVQAGLAYAGSAFRAGFALRSGGNVHRDETVGYTDFHFEWRREEDSASVLEPAVGIGYTWENHHLDIEFSMADHRVTHQDDDLDVHARLEFTGAPTPAVASRIALDLGGAGELALAGAFTAGRHAWNVRAVTSEVATVVEKSAHCDDWSASILWAPSLPGIDWAGIHARLEGQRAADAFVQGQSLSTSRWTSRHAVMGISARHPIHRDLDLLAGITEHHLTANHESVHHQGDPGARYLTESNVDTTYEEFSWGIAYAWRTFRFIGSMDTTLDLDYTFLSVDLQVIP